MGSKEMAKNKIFLLITRPFFVLEKTSKPPKPDKKKLSVK